MPWWGCLRWGLFGGALVTGLDVVSVVGRIGDRPTVLGKLEVGSQPEAVALFRRSG